MCAMRVTGDLRRELILAAAKRCFARYGFAGTTTKRIASTAEISEALVFKHFASKSALYAETLTETCKTDPTLQWLLSLPPSTATLVTLMREMVKHFMKAAHCPDQDEAQRMRLLFSSYLDDGDFARLLYNKITELIAPLFRASIERAVAVGDAEPVAGDPLTIFFFAHQFVHIVALSKLPASSPVPYPDEPDFERLVCEFALRGIGLKEKAIADHLKRDSAPDADLANLMTSESA